MPLTPYYRYCALTTVAKLAAILAGVIAYEIYVGPLPEGIEYGLWPASIMLPSSFTAIRFVQNHRRIPTDEEKRQLSRVSFGLNVIIGTLPFIAVVAWYYAMAFLVADPAYQLYYYAYWQKAVSLFISLGPGLWLLLAGLLAFSLTVSYLMIRWQYGGMAQKMAARLPSP
ncbi:hypothetical protein BBX50_03015 [Ensifer sp. LC11]|nr:hypothetical protein BBX50_03015 [Ensifer sp. LC11]